MNDDIIFKSILNVGRYQIKVSVADDYHCSPLEYINIKELKSNPLPLNAHWYNFAGYEESPFDHTGFAIDNFYHNAYFKVDCGHWNDERFFVFEKSVKDLQTDFSKMGYAKHDAWLKALSDLKNQAKYTQEWFNENWSYIGLIVEVTECFIDDSGLIWSEEIECDALWGIEWSNWLESGDNNIINNETQFKRIIPDLLPPNITLTEDQMNNLWLELESP